MLVPLPAQANCSILPVFLHQGMFQRIAGFLIVFAAVVLGFAGLICECEIPPHTKLEPTLDLSG